VGREVRRVPADWKHPKNDEGHYLPMHKHFPYNEEKVQEGLKDGWLKDEPPNYGCDVMPQWPASERTHLQMYETCSEGTPISPVMETPKKLARWLADNGASANGSSTASYEAWLATIKRGWAPSMAGRAGEITSGVEGLAKL
jgi:hypothetical protein